MRTPITWMAAVLCMGLVACGEKPQTAGTRKADQSAYTSTAGAYTAAGWKAGDQAGWERQVNARTQSGQNEYNRTVGP